MYDPIPVILSTLAAARVTVPHLSIQSFRARAKVVGADQASKNRWDPDDQLKEKRGPRFKAPPTESQLKRAERTYAADERHSLERDAAGRNLDRRIESDLRGAPTDFDTLMDLSIGTDFAYAGPAKTGMSMLPIRSRSPLNVSEPQGRLPAAPSGQNLRKPTPPTDAPTCRQLKRVMRQLNPMHQLNPLAPAKSRWAISFRFEEVKL